jgi:hypothetical protein
VVDRLAAFGRRLPVLVVDDQHTALDRILARRGPAAQMIFQVSHELLARVAARRLDLDQSAAAPELRQQVGRGRVAEQNVQIGGRDARVIKDDGNSLLKLLAGPVQQPVTNRIGSRPRSVELFLQRFTAAFVLGVERVKRRLRLGLGDRREEANSSRCPARKSRTSVSTVARVYPNCSPTCWALSSSTKYARSAS